MSPKQSTLISIILSVGFVLFLFAIISRQPDVMPPAPPEFPTPSVFTPSPTDTLVSLITPPEANFSSWKTYKNDQYGYEFKYPENWLIENDFNTIYRLLGPETQKTRSVSEYPGLSLWYDIMLDTIVKDDLPQYMGLGLKSISDIASSKYSYYFKESKTTTFAGNTAVEAYEQGECRYHVIYIDNSESLLKVSLPCNQSKENLTSIQNQILSTFKFTGQ